MAGERIPATACHLADIEEIKRLRQRGGAP